VSIGFTDILIFGTPCLAVIFTYLLIRGRDGDGLKIVRGRKILYYVHYLLVLSLIVVTIYSAYIGVRPLLFFIIAAALFVTSILCKVNPIKNSRLDPSLLAVVVLAICMTTAVVVGNNFYPVGLGEPRLQTGSLTWSEPVLSAGSIESYQSGYYFIPLEPLIAGSIALITGSPLLTPLIQKSAFLLGSILALYVLLQKLSSEPTVGIIGAFLLISTPVFSYGVGRSVSLSYFIFYMLFILLLYKLPRPSVAGLLVVGLPMVFAHAEGFVAVAISLVPLALLRINGWPTEGNNSRRIRLAVLITIIVTLAYWIHTYLVTLVARQGTMFYSVVSTYLSGETGLGGGEAIYVPNYFRQGQEFSAYSWSIPAALSAALTIYVIYQLVKRRKFDPKQSFIILSAFFGLLLLFFTFLSYSVGPEPGEYLLSVSYLLLLPSAAMVVAKLLHFKKISAILVTLLVALSVLMGMYSPTWAPLEHPEFEATAKIHPFHVYVESNTVTPLISNETTVYYDYDFLISSGLYKPTRNILYEIFEGEDPAQFAEPPMTLFGVKIERLSQCPSLLTKDVVYSSGYHIISAIHSSGGE